MNINTNFGKIVNKKTLKNLFLKIKLNLLSCSYNQKDYIYFKHT